MLVLCAHSGEVGLAAAVGWVDGVEQYYSAFAEPVHAVAAAVAGEEADTGRDWAVAAAMECLAMVVDMSRRDTGIGEVEVERTAGRLDCVRAIVSRLPIQNSFTHSLAVGSSCLIPEQSAGCSLSGVSMLLMCPSSCAE